MIFKTKLPDLDKFEDVVIGQELRMEELEPEIAQLRRASMRGLLVTAGEQVSR